MKAVRGGGSKENVCYEIMMLRAAACVDESDHQLAPRTIVRRRCATVAWANCERLGGQVYPPPPCLFQSYYCRTYEKAVSGGGGGKKEPRTCAKGHH